MLHQVDDYTRWDIHCHNHSWRMRCLFICRRRWLCRSVFAGSIRGIFNGESVYALHFRQCKIEDNEPDHIESDNYRRIWIGALLQWHNTTENCPNRPKRNVRIPLWSVSLADVTYLQRNLLCICTSTDRNHHSGAMRHGRIQRWCGHQCAVFESQIHPCCTKR